ncbi:T9SS type A sorting domain-containing protein [Formosa sp. A9]|uniref:pectate lyase family protein n=1 Tax=Formosa sp. A9 TaxID=3442641 RepID=UPI003EBEAE41
MKNQLFICCAFLWTIISWGQQPTITNTQGWLESAFITWQPIVEANSYRVYYSGEGQTDVLIDDQLVRDYGSYFRADVLGLKPGQYTLSVAAVIDDIESEKTISETITVKPHDRTGFSFSNGRVPGAYKQDGTPKDQAVILYITENTKNTITLEVTGANNNPCVGLQNILEGFKKGKDARPLIIRAIGQITDLEYMDKGDIVIENNNLATSYITFEGVGNDAVADGWGIRIKNASNIEVRNLATMNTDSNEGDNIGLQQDNEYIWIHHCDFFYGDAGSDSDQAKGDGALDCKRSTYVTFSYNHFWDTGKSNLLGLSENTTEGLYITYHHNWYDHSDSRHPRVRFYSAHVYNNYYDGNAKYGVGATLGSSVFVESNYFRNCKYPILTSMQGSDVYNETTGANDYGNMPTFSKEDGGSIKVFNNVILDAKRFVAYGDPNFPNSTVDFDGVVVENRNDNIANSIHSNYGNNTYNNFDTDTAILYNYTADTPEEAKTKVMTYSGRMFGGDFKWEFNNAVDDTDSDVNQGLKSALKNYKTTLVAIQNDGENSGNDDDDDNPDQEIIEGDVVHNFTLSGLESSYFDISGNLSDSKGTVTYGDLTLTQCLKIESSTTIKFTTDNASILTLVFNEDFNKTIAVNGEKYSATQGILSIDLPEGVHEITKGDVANLYYMSVTHKALNIEKLQHTEFKVYPNPTTSVLHITPTLPINSIKVFSLEGRLIKTFRNEYGSIDISDIKPGSYLLSIAHSKGTTSKIFVKQ